MTDAFVTIQAKSGAVSEAASGISGVKEVTDVHVVTGDFDIVAQLDLDRPEDLPTVVADEIQSVPGVADTVTHVAYKP